MKTQERELVELWKIIYRLRLAFTSNTHRMLVEAGTEEAAVKFLHKRIADKHTSVFKVDKAMDPAHCDLYEPEAKVLSIDLSGFHVWSDGSEEKEWLV